MLYSKLKVLGLFIALLSSQFIIAQTARMFTMEEAVLMIDKNTKQSLRAKSLSQLQWLPSGNKYSYVINGTGARIVLTEAENGKVDSTITLSVLNEALKAFDPKLSLKSIPVFQWLDNENFRIKQGAKYLSFNISSQSFRELFATNDKAEFEEIEATKGYIAFILNDNIYFIIIL